MKKQPKNDDTNTPNNGGETLSPEKVKSALDAIRKLIDQWAADHDGYFRKLRGNWEGALRNAENFSRDALRSTHLIFPQEAQDILVLPYETFSLLLFARLMDNLTPDEEDWLRDVSARLQAAWKQLLDAFSAQHPALAPTCRHAYRQFMTVNGEVVLLFLGELPPAFTPRWAKSIKALKKDLAKIAKEVA